MAEMPASELIFDKATLEQTLDALATKVGAYCNDDPWLFICVMNGGLVFTGELMLRLDVQMELDYVRVSRYGRDTTGGELHWRVEPEQDLAGRRVMLLDDIYDDGHTLAALVQYCREKGASDVKSCVLLEKLHSRAKADIRPDWVGMECPDRYVFGFGMDYEGLYRNLPEVWALDQS